jgi:IS30 family transposase
MVPQADMARTYKHLIAVERDIIAAMKAQGKSLGEIGVAIGRDKSTVSRELRRNCPSCHTGYYLSHKAQDRAVIRFHRSHKRPRLKNERIKNYVIAQLQDGMSPELIAGRIQKDLEDASISHEAIYQWIYNEAREFIACLVRQHRKRMPRGHSRKHRKLHIPQRVAIDQRPAVIEKRRQMGHWEVDTAVSRQSKASLHVMAERVSRFTKITKLDRKGARESRIAMNRRLSRLPRSMRRSFTYDNGPENTEHIQVNKTLRSRSYFCNPYHSWEKGTVENTVGLIRRFLPKKTDFASVSKNEIKTIETWLNNRPRKCLDFYTPAEVFYRRVALTG